MLCPCGSSELFTHCCQPIIDGEKKAKSPEQLMRSRYSAYATNNAQYIFATYAKTSQQSQTITDIQQWALSCKFIALTIHQSSEFTPLLTHSDVHLPTVEFTAYYLEGNKLYKMSERSRFVKEPNLTSTSLLTSQSLNDTQNAQWLYLDGDVGEHQDLGIIKRNDPCPCAINQARDKHKKYKKCCGE